MQSNVKPNISSSKLCRQVTKVIGQVEAIKQLNIAYKNYEGV